MVMSSNSTHELSARDGESRETQEPIPTYMKEEKIEYRKTWLPDNVVHYCSEIQWNQALRLIQEFCLDHYLDVKSPLLSAV